MPYVEYYVPAPHTYLIDLDKPESVVQLLSSLTMKKVRIFVIEYVIHWTIVSSKLNSSINVYMCVDVSLMLHTKWMYLAN